MTGPQHYREAERLIEQSRHYTYDDGSGEAWGREYGASLLLEAQAHATLALAAATALAGDGDLLMADCYAWRVAAASDPADVERAREQLKSLDVAS